MSIISLSLSYTSRNDRVSAVRFKLTSMSQKYLLFVSPIPVSPPIFQNTVNVAGMEGLPGVTVSLR